MLIFPPDNHIITAVFTIRPNTGEEAACVPLTDNKRTNEKNPVSHFKKRHLQETKLSMEHVLHISASIPWAKECLIYVFHSSGLLIFSGPLDCQYIC